MVRNGPAVAADPYEILAREHRLIERVLNALGRLCAQSLGADCAACETKDGLLDRIERDVELRGELTVDQRARLLEIANKCPVHRTLTSEIDIRTRLSASENR